MEAHGGTVLPPRNRKGGAGNPPPTDARAIDLPDNPFLALTPLGAGSRLFPPKGG
jgi:hypothetical protein